MGRCKYCGQNAGLFKDKHIECEQKHIAELKRIENEKTNIVENILSNFSDTDKEKLEAVYQEKRKGIYLGNIFSDDFGKNPISMTSGEDTLKAQLLKHDKPIQYFSSLVGGFNYVDEFNICEKMFNIIDSNNDLINDYSFLHFYYITKIKVYYRNRDLVEGAFDMAVESCENMIKIAKQVLEVDSMVHGASHPGYEQLAIILHKQGKYEDVIKLCKQAKSEKWNGDWDSRIERAKKKLDKQK
jgi:tetratricopeptide (TPR) repeat protein